MGILEIVLLAAGLAMDSAAVSAARSLAAPKLRARDVVVVGVLFGGFQAGMPLLGWLLGEGIGPYIEAIDHWVAFWVLALLGGKMIKEAWYDDEDAGGPEEVEPFALKVLLPLCVATSIDAFAVGVTLPLLQAPLVLTLTTIGIVTAILSAAGALVARRLGSHFGPRLEMLGGLALVGIGVKILISHIWL